MLLGVVEAEAKMLGVLPAATPAELLLLPTVLTARLPVEVFFTGTTTLLQETHTQRKPFIYSGLPARTLEPIVNIKFDQSHSTLAAGGCQYE